MTAPADLPPVPVFSNTPVLQAAFEMMTKDYAKLAVRQALERVIQTCENVHKQRVFDGKRTGYNAIMDCVDEIRAIIKEYE